MITLWIVQMVLFVYNVLQAMFITWVKKSNLFDEDEVVVIIGNLTSSSNNIFNAWKDIWLKIHWIIRDIFSAVIMLLKDVDDKDDSCEYVDGVTIDDEVVDDKYADDATVDGEGAGCKDDECKYVDDEDTNDKDVDGEDACWKDDGCEYNDGVTIDDEVVDDKYAAGTSVDSEGVVCKGVDVKADVNKSFVDVDAIDDDVDGSTE